MSVLQRRAKALGAWFSRQRAEYSQNAHRPIAGYSVALATYAVGAASAFGLARTMNRPSPQLASSDLILMAVATHKISRALAKDPVTSPLRMPFTTFEGVTAPSELREEVRATGMTHAMGELITCPFCMSPWVASGLFAGYTFAPGATRAVATVYTAVAGSDFLQYAYATTQQRATPPENR